MRTQSKETVDYVFESLNDFADYVSTTPVAARWMGRDAGLSSADTSDDDWEWHGGATLEDAVALARDGWPEGREEFAGRLMDAAAAKTSQGRSEMFELSVAGLRPDIGAYCAGAPECMLQVSAGADVTARVVYLTVGLSNSCTVQPAAVRNWGAAVCILIDSIEAQDQSVELTGAFSSFGGGRKSPGTKGYTVNTDVLLKAAGAPLDVDCVAFAMAHGGMHRRMQFRLIETDDVLYDGHGDAYGTSRTPSTMDARAVLIPSITNGGFAQAAATLEGAIEAVCETYDKAVSQ